MGPKHPYEYSVDDIGFRTLHECTVVCSEANFDDTLPSEKESRISNDPHLTEAQKTKKIS